MTAPADRIVTNVEGHTLTEPDETFEAVAIRDGRIVRVGRAEEVRFLEGVETGTHDFDGATLLPGFVDAHTHMDILGRRQVETDLGDASGPREAVSRLQVGAEDDGWILGFGYDESTWEASRYLTREDLDRVSDDRPVAAFREDLHVVSVNGVALDRLEADLPDEGVRTEGGEPTGVLVESALEAVTDAIAPDADQTREYLRAAQSVALDRGVTAVHDMIRNRHVPGVYRELDLADELDLRVRLNYWADFLDALEATGARTNHGSDRVETGAIKTYTDGSIGGRTAKLSRPYADADTDGTWVRDPDDLAVLAERVADGGFQMAAHAIGDAAIEAVLDAYVDIEGGRHRIEHAELLTDEAIERLADAGTVVSAQPNFHRWARPNGLYETALGPERRARTNRFAALRDAGVRLAFGSDCMPLDPLFGVRQAVTAPESSQRLSVTEALRAYTLGGAYAGFDEDRLGTVEPGKRADLVALAESPWEVPDAVIDDIDVVATLVGGEIVADSR
ncbi:putative metal-dependent hydrolase with the TIM-barrel fold [Halapricum desulfuricans]|uniref:Putative metal-dependent hydrolase with the TIM-barrel fold n=1 Tax=Halapricum desulfuricans TaxID=2841257 RepID=A0A897NKV6_9EURY|nr:amidohydrolase [Halapricum desulfuricans]QSG13392.1 putative metal-dependent hydrolase with the TIM-barrel fold [Halapricum desulfuricans]